MKVAQRVADAQPSGTAQPEFADRAFVIPAAFLDNRERLAHFAIRLEISQHDDRVGEITRVHRRLHRGADEPCVRTATMIVATPR